MRVRTLAIVTLVLAALLVPLDAATTTLAPAAALQLRSPVVGMAASPSGGGYWLVASDGGIFSFGDAGFHGSTGNLTLASPVVGMAPTPSGGGYWLVAADGGIFSFGDANFHGSTGAMRLNSPVVGMAATPSGGGYWLVARDGGIFAFGDAGFFGSTGGLPLNSPIVGMSTVPDGRGYRLVASDGGVFSFGDATFHGSTGNLRLVQPVTGMAATPSGGGYWLVARDGGIFAFGDAPFKGSTGGVGLNQPIVGMAATPTASGYWLGAGDGGIFAFGDAVFRGSAQETAGPSSPPGPPRLTVTTLVSGLAIPWDLAFTPDGTLLFTERAGRIKVRLGDGTVRQVAAVGGLYVAGETGLLGMALDPGFAGNRTFFTCQTNASPREVQVVRWTIDAGYTTAMRASTPLVTGIPSTADFHNGCRPRFGSDGMLYVGTGDSGQGPAPQSLSSRGGKVLRVDPASGAVAIHSRGHRNLQGLAMRPGTDQLFTVEHGPDRDDEVNRLPTGRVAGANAGWDPNRNGSYDQSVPMTDTAKFPDALLPVWASGSPTIATSGAAFVTGSAWGSWDGALIVACLKAKRLQVFTLDDAGNVTSSTAALGDVGARLRTPLQGPDGALYITTSNGSDDKILRVSPS